MEQLIPVINKMQELFARANLPNYLDLPQIVVIGAQSTGKTSVLESIVGKDFLPRGTGIVTRRPIILQLRHIQSGGDYAVFGHLPNEKFENFDLVKREIQVATDSVAGTNKGISSEPILVKVFSKTVLDITLIDLPGITKVPIGDQPQDIELQVKSMLLEFVSKENAIILALTAGNTDLANSDALKLAREVDPSGNRTIGVVTKLDLMDKGTDAMDMLSGKIYPLKLGYIGAICRSQNDITNKKALSAQLLDEQKFFLTHPTYNQISHRSGIKFLTVSLNEVLMSHIKACLPSIKNNISRLLHNQEQEMLAYGLDFMDKEENKGAILLNLLSKFANYYCSMIDGQNVLESTKEYLGGARISYIFYQIFGETILGMDPFDNLSDEDIRTAIKNAQGLRPTLFVPEGAFEILIRQQIVRLLEPSQQCIQMIYEELRKIIEMAQIPELKRYHKLQARIFEVMDELLHNCLKPTNEMIENLIQVEDAYININHPDFVGGTNAILSIFAQRKKEDSPLIKQFEVVIESSSEEGEEATYMQEEKKIREEEERLKKTQEKMSESTRWNIFGLGAAKKNSIGKGKEAKEHEEGKGEEQWDSLNDFFHDKNPNLHGGQMGNNYKGGKGLPPIPVSMRANNASAREQMETKIIKQLITSYFNVVRKNINDLVPKTIMAFLVNKSKIMAQRELVAELYQDLNIEGLMEENPLLAEKRKQGKQMVDTLREALRILNELRDYKIANPV